MAQVKTIVDDKSLTFEERKIKTPYSALTKLLPSYDGNRRTLAFYIENVENTLELIHNTEDLNVSCLIRNKLKGKAAEALTDKPDARSWTEIKKVLLRKFGESRTASQLVHALTHVTRDNTSLEAFGDRIRVLKTALITAEPENQIHYEQIALETFLKGLNPITALSIKIRHVENLDQAVILAKQEEVDLRARRLQQNRSTPSSVSAKNKFTNKCDSCPKIKYEQKPLKLPISLTNIPYKPMEHMFVDLYSIGGTTFLTIIDNFTKYAQAIPLTGSTSIHIAEALLSLFAVVGVPKRLTTDSDSKFHNETITDIFALYDIYIHFTTPYKTNSNSPIERFHFTLAETIRIQRLTDQDESVNLMKYAIIAYNNTIHSATGFTPFELLYGHTDSRNPLELHCPKKFYQEYVTKHKKNIENTQLLLNKKLASERQPVIQK